MFKLFLLFLACFCIYEESGFTAEFLQSPQIQAATSIEHAANIAAKNGPERAELINRCDSNVEIKNSTECLIAKRFP